MQRFVRGSSFVGRLSSLYSGQARKLAVPVTKNTVLRSVACMSQLHGEKMAVVRSFPGSSSMLIQVQIAGKLRNLDRPKDEMVDKALMRLQKTVCQKPKGKKKSKEFVEDVPPPVVSLYSGPDESFPLVDPSKTSNIMAWKDGNMLRIGDLKYAVVVDPPFVERLQVHGSIFPGVPTVPFVDTTDATRLEWQWYRLCDNLDDWKAVDSGDRSFVPGPQDVGSKLMVSCTPVQRRRDPLTHEEYELKGGTSSLVVGPVAAAPEFASAGRLAKPLSWTQHPDFRVMTYNILADQYASTDRAKEELFAHCPSEFLEPQYRRPLVFKEILDYKPDVVCLQEVDESAFNLLFQPGLLEFGIHGVFTSKAGRVKEGSATFWRADRFRLVDREEMELRAYFPKDASKRAIDSAPLGPALRPMLQSSPALCEALQKVGTVAQLTLLAPTGAASTWGDARPLCVVNTHLYFHYAAPHIRTLHVWAMLHHAKEFINKSMASRGGELGDLAPSVIFCGDLNSDINDGIPGAVRLLDRGAVGADYWDWKFGRDFAWGKTARGEGDGEGQGGDRKDGTDATDGSGPGTGAADITPRTDIEGVVEGLDLTSPFSLQSADGMEPEFTNYVKGFEGLLDYVWYDTGHIRVKGTLPQPTKAQLGNYLPTAQYPSDHLAVVADLQFIPGSSGVANAMGDSVMHAGTTTPARKLTAVFRNVPEAEAALLEERVIAVPTDTIYGIAALASSETAINAIYDIKKRDHAKPLAVCVADHHNIANICHTTHLPEGLLNHLLPGPVTIILDRRRDSKQISGALNPGVDALAVRIPDFPFLRAICRQVQTPLALTSANLSGEQSPVHTSEFGHIAESCAIVFDNGALGQQLDLSDALKRAGSTIVDLRTPGVFEIVREGSALDATKRILAKSGLIFTA